MKRQYFFESYSWKGNDGLKNLKYCPTCGTKCTKKEESLRVRPVCPSCGFVHYRNPYPGVVVLIEKEGLILLGKRALGSFQAGKWCLPGGFVEFDENFIVSAVREVKEETDLDVEINSIISVSSNFLSSDLHALVISLRANVINGIPKPGDDIEELKWFNMVEQLPEMAFSADTYLIESFLKEEKIEMISLV